MPQIYSKEDGRYSPRNKWIDILDNISIAFVNLGIMLSLFIGILVPWILLGTIPMTVIGALCVVALYHNIKVEYCRLYEKSLTDTQKDIREFQYTRRYNLIIFGDILEHLTVEDAQMVLCEAKKWGEHILIGVPYLYKQEPLYGNEAERHLQEDLTHEIFTLRYPEYEFIFGKFGFYGYYYR